MGRGLRSTFLAYWFKKKLWWLIKNKSKEWRLDRKFKGFYFLLRKILIISSNKNKIINRIEMKFKMIDKI